MLPFLQVPVHKGLSDSLHAAIDTGNHEEIYGVIDNAEDAFAAGQIDAIQLGDLLDDFRMWEEGE
ncbi:hypothetical protein D3C85_1510650 [compost metagenome]|jgi:hypothetical protein